METVKKFSQQKKCKDSWFRYEIQYCRLAYSRQRANRNKFWKHLAKRTQFPWITRERMADLQNIDKETTSGSSQNGIHCY